MSFEKFLMVVAQISMDDGEVLLRSLADGEVPCEMRWVYGSDTTVIKDVVGESYLVTIEKLSEAVSS